MQLCQDLCSELYNGICNWFIYDQTTNDCKLFNGSVNALKEDCREMGYMKEPSIDLCAAEFEADSDNGCFVSMILVQTILISNLK